MLGGREIRYDSRPGARADEQDPRLTGGTRVISTPPRRQRRKRSRELYQDTLWSNSYSARVSDGHGWPECGGLSGTIPACFSLPRASDRHGWRECIRIVGTILALDSSGTGAGSVRSKVGVWSMPSSGGSRAGATGGGSAGKVRRYVRRSLGGIFLNRPQSLSRMQ